MKFTKRMLAVFMSLLMVITAIPFGAFTAYADDDLDSAMGEFMTWVGVLASNDYSVLYDNLSDAYLAYVNAYDAKQTEDLEDDEEAYTELREALDNVAAKPVATGTYAPKIGDGEVQPDSDYYANVIYSDGYKATDASNWADNGNGRVGTQYAGMGIGINYWTTVAVYYGNTVLLWDGKTNPMLPVVMGVTQGYHKDSGLLGNHVASAGVVLEGVYESNPDINLIGNWKGTTDGYAEKDNDSPRLVTTPSWTDATDTTENYTEIGILPSLTVDDTGRDPYRNVTLFVQEDEGKYYTHHNEDGKWQVYKNALVYSPKTSPKSMLTVIDQTTWGGCFGFHYLTEGVNYGNSDNWTNNTLSENGSDVEGHEIDGNDIYILNYEALLNAITKCIQDNQSYLNAAYLNNGSLYPVFRAIEDAIEFDPYSYDYDSDVAAASTQAGERISELVEELTYVRPSAIEAQIENLADAISDYETKMNSGVIWSKMEPAYKAYIVAREYYDAYTYGMQTEFDPSIKEVSHNLIVATNNMEERANSYNTIPNKAFADDVASDDKAEEYDNSFYNLVFSQNINTIEGIPGDDLEFPADVETLFYNEGTWRNTGEITYLIVPKTVAVYDGDEAGDVMKTAAMLGFMAFGGRAGAWSLGEDRNSRYLSNYWSLSDKLTFNSPWKTSTLETVKTYTNYASLNEIMKAPADALGYSETDVNPDTGEAYVTKSLSDNAAGTDDAPIYFANTLTIGVPDEFSTKEKNDIDKYLYHYSTIPVGMSAYNSDNSALRTTLSTSRNVDFSGSIRTGGSDSIGQGNVLFEGSISIYVINYSPVRRIITNNATYIEDEDFDIRNYVEGGLHTYLTDMDALTAVDPNEYFDSMVTSSTYANKATECATDIMNLINSTSLDETTPPEENGPLGIFKDTTTADGGAYYRLIDLLKTANEITKNCQAPKLFDTFTQKLENARAQIRAITGISTTTETHTTQYATGTTAAAVARLELVQQAYEELVAAIDAMSVENLLGHRFIYDDEENDIAEFKCSLVSTHTHGTDIDMSAYNALDIVYGTMDLTKYNDTSFIEDGRAVFEAVKNQATQPVFLNAAADYLDVGTRTYANYETAIQEYVDNGIAELLTAINISNGEDNTVVVDDAVNEYTVTFHVVKADGTTENGYFGNDNAAVESKVFQYGNSVLLDSKSDSIYRWVIKSQADGVSSDALTTTKLISSDSATQELKIQSNVEVTAYEVPNKTDEQYYVDITDYYGDTMYKLVCSANDVITYERPDGAAYYEVSVKGYKYNVPDYTNYKLTGYPFASGTTVGAIADADTKTAKVKPTATTINQKNDYTISLDNQLLESNAWYDYEATIRTNVENAYGIAVKIKGAIDQDSYIPVAYATQYTYFVNRDMEFFTIVKDPATGKYTVTDCDTVVTFTDADLKLFLDNKLPFIYSAVVTIGDYNVTKNAYTVLPNDGNVEITEAGIAYTKVAGLDEDTLVEGTDGVKLAKAKNVIQPGNQFGASLAKSTTTTYYTRPYIKFTYHYNGSTISAVYYGTINIINPTNE